MNRLYNCQHYKKSLQDVFESVKGISRFRRKRILITGASGMIGSFLVDFLIFCNEEKNFECEIYAAGRKTEQLKERFTLRQGPKGLHFLLYDMGRAVDWSFPVDMIIHAAGEGSPAHFMSDPVSTIKDTVFSVCELLNFGTRANVERFLYVSSGEIYGGTGHNIGTFREEMGSLINPALPRACYPISKIAAENLCVSWSLKDTECKRKIMIGRLCHTYGPSMREDDFRAASCFLREAAAGCDIIMNSPGEQMRSWCYIGDCVGGMLTVLLEGESGQAYNIANKKSRSSIMDLARMIAEEAGVNVGCHSLKEEEINRINPMKVSVLSTDKLEYLGWGGLYNLKEGIRLTLAVLKELRNSEA